MTTLHVKGTVISGKQEGARFIKLPWVEKQITAKLGFTPFSGTLNVKMTEDDADKLEKASRRAKSIDILPEEGFSRGKCFKAYLTENVECAVVIPEIGGYSKDVLEIVASVNLRKRLDLQDGDSVDIKITLEENTISA